MSVTESAPLPSVTGRFQVKREKILDAATTLINLHGVKGMTFVGVAKLVELNTTSITYYFKRKEQLAAAVIHRSIDQLETLVEEAKNARTPRERIANYIQATVELHARIRRQESPPIAHLSDIRSLDLPHRAELSDRYIDYFRSLRALFGDTTDDRRKAVNTARTHAFIESVFWLPAWIKKYSISDFDRVSERLFDVFDNGIAAQNVALPPQKSIALDESENNGDMTANFLRAATHLINERGYRGASVNRIAEKLSVTKGSFYHHLDGKDDLVLECFRMSYARVSKIQQHAIEADGDYWRRISSCIASLIDLQFYSDFPLLRTTALHALPTEIRSTIIDRSDRIARRFAGMLADGVAEGSVRPLDPLIASQVIMSTLNGAYELRRWASALPHEEASTIYASIIAYGLFSDR